MKKRITIIGSILGLIVLAFLYIYSNIHTVISIESSDIALQSDVSINLIQAQGNKVTNLTTFSKNKLNTNSHVQQKIDITIDSDGKITLQVKVNGIQYEGIVIPYVTNGNPIYSIDVQIIEKDNDLFIVGEYDTLLEDNQEVNSKLELKKL